MSNDPFASPATANGIKWNDVHKSLVIVDVLSLEKDLNTAFGTSDAVRANIAVIDGEQKGETYEDCLIFPKGLQSQLKSKIGQKVIGRVTQGQAKAGQSAPWLLAEATEADRKAGMNYLAGALATADTPPY